MYNEAIVAHNAAIADLILTMLTALGMSGFCIGIVIILLRHSLFTRDSFTIKRARSFNRDYSRQNKRISSY